MLRELPESAEGDFVTIYVDSVFIPTTVKGHKSRWCHLVTDQYDSAELHPFATRIGLKRAYFQYRSKIPGTDCAPPWQWHYDVVESMRDKAIAAGAVVLPGWELGPIMQAKREIFGRLSEEDKQAERVRWEAIALGTEAWKQAGLF